jgi:hypothetical protein
VSRVSKRPSLPPDLKLSPEEGFVLSRIDGAAEVRALEALTGLPLEQVERIVEKLVDVGVLEHKSEDGSDSVDAEDEPAANDVERATTHRARWSEKFRGLPPERRRVLANAAESADLLALAYDVDPQVLRAVLSNPKAGAQVARVIAAHAQSIVALEGLARFMNDGGVQRLLLRNAHTSEGLLRRILARKPLVNVYAAATDRDAAEAPRNRAKLLFRERFTQGTPEEKSALLIKTEGRVLMLLSGVPLDARTSTLLCAKTITSSLFVQNLARYNASPPALLLHLVKQPFVKRQPHLLKMLAQHANMPREGKGLS